MSKPSDFVQGTLDVLLLKILALEPLHGWAISQRLKAVSGNVLQVSEGSLYPALHKLGGGWVITAEWESDGALNKLGAVLFADGSGRKALEEQAADWDRLSALAAVSLVLRLQEGSDDDALAHYCSFAGADFISKRRVSVELRMRVNVPCGTSGGGADCLWDFAGRCRIAMKELVVERQMERCAGDVRAWQAGDSAGGCEVWVKWQLDTEEQGDDCYGGAFVGLGGGGVRVGVPADRCFVIEAAAGESSGAVVLAIHIWTDTR